MKGAPSIVMSVKEIYQQNPDRILRTLKMGVTFVHTVIYW